MRFLLITIAQCITHIREKKYAREFDVRVGSALRAINISVILIYFDKYVEVIGLA